jgi:hypothetical protein
VDREPGAEAERGNDGARDDESECVRQEWATTGRLAQLGERLPYKQEKASICDDTSSSEPHCDAVSALSDSSMFVSVRLNTEPRDEHARKQWQPRAPRTHLGRSPTPPQRTRSR